MRAVSAELWHPVLMQTWRLPWGLRIALVLIGAIFAAVGVAMLLHGLGITHSANKDFFPGRPTNVVIGTLFIIGGLTLGPLAGFRTKMRATTD